MSNRIGISLSRENLSGRIPQLEQDLDYVSGLGFGVVELPISGLDVVVGATIQDEKVDVVSQILKQFDLVYTVHAPNSLNLVNPRSGRTGEPDIEHEMAVFSACIDFASAIGSQILTYHCGIKTGREGEGEQRQELQALTEIASYAEKNRVVVGLENTETSISRLLEQVKRVDSRYIGVTLDLAHLFLAAHSENFDYVASIVEAAPWVRHVHHNDNFGRVTDNYSFADRIVWGDGDLHLPIGWGTIPHAQAIQALGKYEGLYILEVAQRFRDHWRSCLVSMESLVRAE